MPFIPQITEVPFEIKVSSGKTDSFEDLNKLLQLKTEVQNKLAIQFAEDLKLNASKKLYSTKDTYIEAITVNGETVVLNTEQFVVNMVENGVESFDMKPGLLKSPKAKVSKNGSRYIVVPLGTTKKGKYNWRNQETGQFKKSTSGVKGTEFRIVSDKSASDSWIFPGYEGNHFVDQTLKEFDQSFDDSIEQEISKLFE